MSLIVARIKDLYARVFEVQGGLFIEIQIILEFSLKSRNGFIRNVHIIFS